MKLKDLLDKTADADVLQDMISLEIIQDLAVERLMELEVSNLTGAGLGDKSAERLAQRNSYLANELECLNRKRAPS